MIFQKMIFSLHHHLLWCIGSLVSSKSSSSSLSWLTRERVSQPSSLWVMEDQLWQDRVLYLLLQRSLIRLNTYHLQQTMDLLIPFKLLRLEIPIQVVEELCQFWPLSFEIAWEKSSKKDQQKRGPESLSFLQDRSNHLHHRVNRVPHLFQCNHPHQSIVLR